MEFQAEIIPEDERLISLFAHLSFFFGSLIIPLIFWLVYREKSKFITFNSVQALIFHIVYIGMNFILIGCLAVIMGLAGLLNKSGGIPSTPNIIPLILIIIVSLIIIGFIGFCIFYSIYMAVLSYKGKTKMYPVIGNIVYKKIYGLS